MDILFVIGLPRSGTSLVHNLIHKETGRNAPTYKDLGIKVDRLPGKFYDLNPTFKDESSLAEDNDFDGTLGMYRDWLALRGERWVCKSPDHVSRLCELLDVFPEARFLICLREAAATLASIREYYQLMGVGPEYNIVRACSSLGFISGVFPEKFDWINVNTIPEFESDRVGVPTTESNTINYLYSQIKGNCNRVDSRNFKERYSPKGARATEA
jgi:hypothetical protein